MHLKITITDMVFAGRLTLESLRHKIMGTLGAHTGLAENDMCANVHMDLNYWSIDARSVLNPVDEGIQKYHKNFSTSSLRMCTRLNLTNL